MVKFYELHSLREHLRVNSALVPEDFCLIAMIPESTKSWGKLTGIYPTVPIVHNTSRRRINVEVILWQCLSFYATLHKCHLLCRVQYKILNGLSVKRHRHWITPKMLYLTSLMIKLWDYMWRLDSFFFTK